MTANSQFLQRCLAVATCIVIAFSTLQSQTFWERIETFPGEPKTGIAIASGSCLFVGLTDGIITRCDEASAFELSLGAEVIFTVFAARNGSVYGGGAGKIYFTRNLGADWDSVSLNTPYPVTQIIENSAGDLFAITGVLNIEEGYLGDGVFYSNDNGMTWQTRNTGLGNYRSCERIAIDKNDRLYVCLADEFVTGNAGLFVSDDNGMTWEHVTITIDGRGVIDNTIKIGNTMGLNVSPADSLYFSFAGTAVNAAVTLNTCKHIDDVQNTEFWRVYPVFQSVSWWLDRPLFNIFYASNGDWYSSVKGTINSGGTYYSRDQGLNWKFINYSLGIDNIGLRSRQFFAEHATGKIYMAQLLDEDIYSTDSSLLSSIQPLDRGKRHAYSLYPNPMFPGQTGSITGLARQSVSIELFDGTGRKLSSPNSGRHTDTFTAPRAPGIYYLSIIDGVYRAYLPLVVIEPR